MSLSFLYSRSNSGVKISDLYPDLATVCEMVLTDQPEEVDILFLCLPHKESQKRYRATPGAVLSCTSGPAAHYCAL